MTEQPAPAAMPLRVRPSIQPSIDMATMPDVENEDFRTIADGIKNAIMPRANSIHVMRAIHHALDFDTLPCCAIC